MLKYAVFDIDHTVSDAYWRDNLIGGEGGWDAYHIRAESDAPINEIIDMVNMFNANPLYRTVGLTTMPEKWRGLRCAWLVKFGVLFDHLLMRPNDDFRIAAEAKIDNLKLFLGKDFPDNVAFVMDDNEKVIEKFKAAGITTLHINASRRKI